MSSIVAAPKRVEHSSRPLPGVRILGLAIVALFAAAVSLAVTALLPSRPALGPRVANETVRLPLSPPSNTAWRAVDAFGGLRFFEPTGLAAARDGSGRMYVLERRGTVQLVQAAGAAETESSPRYEKRLALDIFASVSRTKYDDDGALGLVLHPEFGRPDSPHRGYFYVFYTAQRDGERYDRLSRFTIPAGQVAADRRSELVLIEQRDRNLWHNGGGLAFGPDGFLYVGVGDEGGEADEFKNGQEIRRNLFAGILRIDVDRRGGSISHPPPRQPDDGRTAGYFIPSDNPFVGRAGVLEEFWSIGYRNPHRISFDPEGRLWVGDVGQNLREEINIATAASNHQWSYAEGRLPFARSYLAGRAPAEHLGVETPPLYDYPHLNGDNCVIGGYVYRGRKYPEWAGRYIFADNGSGRIRALELASSASEPAAKAAVTELAALPVTSKTGISSLAEDADGELFVIVLGEADEEQGTIYRLEPAPPGSSNALPELLSRTGLFTDLAALAPTAGMYPFAVNSPLWSDGAEKQRWILLPGDGTDPDPAADRIEYAAAGPWSFPAGTVFVKHFDMPVDESDPGHVKRLETRVLVRHAHGGVYGTTYRWNEAGTDARRVDADELETLAIRTADGGSRMQTWQYPGPQTCLACHTEQAGHVLGVNARQLNGTLRYPDSGLVENQLRAWSQAGFFTRPLAEEDLAAAPRLVPLNDVRAPLDERARSYLDSNCANCHLPGGARANFDARYETPLARQNLLGGLVNTHDGLPGGVLVRPGDPAHSTLLLRMLHGARPMPPVGVRRRDYAAIELLSEWIDRLPPMPELPPVPLATPPEEVAAPAE